MIEIDRETAQRVIALPLPDFGENATVESYLVTLLSAFWRGQASPKYGMSGESDWQYELYEPLRDAGLIPVWEKGYGVGWRTRNDHYAEDQELADALIDAAIKELGAS